MSDILDYERAKVTGLPGSSVGGASGYAEQTQSKRLKVRSNPSWGPKPEGQGWMPGVDRWVATYLPRRRYGRIAGALGLLGALGGYGYALDTGQSGVGFAFGGGVAGLLLLPLLVFAVKLVILAATLALIGGVGYLVYQFATNM